MLESFAVFFIAASLLSICAIAGLFSLAFLGDALIIAGCMFFMPVGAGIYYLLTGNPTLATQVFTTTMIVMAIVPAGAFAVSTAIQPSFGKVLLAGCTVIALVANWSLQ